jgi:hypothetical protein
MKNMYTFIFLFILSPLYLIAQDNAYVEVKGPDNLKYKSLQNFSIPGFFVPANYREIPVNIQKLYDNKILGTTDTLNPFFKRSTGYANYTYQDPNSGYSFPVIGSNTLYILIGQKFDYTGNKPIKGLLIPYSFKRITAPPDTMVIVFYVGDNTSGLPSGNPIGTSQFTLDAVDTSIAAPKFTFIPLTTPVQAPSKFVAFVQTRRLGPDDDANMILSNLQGDGQAENRACFITTNSNNQLVTSNIAQLPLTISGQPLNFDVLVMPVLDIGTGVNNEFTINGIKVKCFNPNPAFDRAGLIFSLEKPGNIEISIVNIEGRLLDKVFASYLAEGEHSLELNLNSYLPGNYFLTINTSGAKFAMSFSVNK